MIRVDVVYDKDHSKLQLLRANLMVAFSKLDLPSHWHEWTTRDRNAPYYVKGYPALTVFINGAPIKIPRDDSSYSIDLVSSEVIEKTFKERNTWLVFRPSKSGQYLFIVATLPFLFLMLIPSLDCPFCWPGYNYGEAHNEINMLGIRNFTAYLFPAILVSLSLSLTAFIYRSIMKNQYQPFLIALCASLSILSSKLIAFDAAMEYGGLVLYIASALWHLADSSHLEFRNCPGCRALRMAKEQNAK